MAPSHSGQAFLVWMETLAAADLTVGANMLPPKNRNHFDHRGPGIRFNVTIHPFAVPFTLNRSVIPKPDNMAMQNIAVPAPGYHFNRLN